MNRALILAVLVVFLLLNSLVGTANSLQFGNLLNQFKNQNPSPNATNLNSGLKELLKVGIENTVKLAGKTNGFLNNPAIKINMPENLKKAESALRMIGLGPKIDEFILSMNKSAENATPLAKDILLNAVTNLNFQDASNIFNGGNTAATDYLRKTTYDKLNEVFKPVVAKTMAQFGVNNKFEEITKKLQTMPIMGKYVPIDINSYVVSKALDGLFWILGQQETKIRTDPKAQTTTLLKELFSGATSQ